MAILKATIQTSPEAPVSPCEVLKNILVKDITLSHKRVSFALARNVEYANEMMNEEECRTLWHTTFDFKKMKENTHAFAKQAVKQDKVRANDKRCYTNIILRVYDQCCNVPTCTTEEDKILSQEDLKDLVFLVGKANSRTGLERIIVRDLAYDKRFRRTEIVKAVRNIQMQSAAASGESVSELMRLACETISCPSRLFARHLAGALEASLWWRFININLY